LVITEQSEKAIPASFIVILDIGYCVTGEGSFRTDKLKHGGFFALNPAQIAAPHEKESWISIIYFINTSFLHKVNTTNYA
jgi:hypothetical protein